MPARIARRFINMSDSPHHDPIDDVDNASNIPLIRTITMSLTSSHETSSRTNNAQHRNEPSRNEESEEDELEEGEIREGDLPTSSGQASESDAIAADFVKRFPWIEEVDAFDPNLTWKPAEWYLENRDINAPALDYSVSEPPAIEFLNTLISIDMDELNPDDRICSICMEPYLSGEKPEMPLQLPCGHVFGKECLFQWMSQIGDATHTNCPMCRYVHVNQRSHIGSLEGLAQLLQQADWMLTRMGPLRLDAEGRERWQSVKDYVNEYLAEQDA